jgi:hypothetical protein
MFSASHYSSEHTSPASWIRAILAAVPLLWKSSLTRYSKPIIPMYLHQCRRGRAPGAADPQAAHTSAVDIALNLLRGRLNPGYVSMTNLPGCAMNIVEARHMYHPLFSPMQDLDTDRVYPQDCLVTQPQVTDLLEAEAPGDAGFGELKGGCCCCNCDIIPSCNCATAVIVLTTNTKPVDTTAW